MNLTLHSSSCGLKYSCLSERCCTSLNSRLHNHYVRMQFIYDEENIQVSDHDDRKLFLSSHLTPKHVEKSFMGKNWLEESSRKLKFVRTLLIDNYDSYTYNIYQELSVINGLPPVIVRNDEWTSEQIRYYLYEEKAFDNIVISPGPGSPTCPDDIGICLHLLRECGDIPILGVCLGHQALGYAYGAKVIHASEPVHGRLSEIEHNGCRLFCGIPSGKNSGFKVVRYHSLVIDPESLPKELVPISWTSSTDALPFLEIEKAPITRDSSAAETSIKTSGDSLSKKLESSSSSSSSSDRTQSIKVLMGIRHFTKPHYGVQFHPESVATCHGKQIFKNFREITKDQWLRLRPSLTKKKMDIMLESHGSRLFNEVPRRKPIIYHADDQLHISSNIVHPEDNRNCFGMFGMVNLSYPSSGVKFLKLRWRKFEGLAGKVGGAKNIFCHLFGQQKAENTFWLDSSSIEKRRARFSFLGGKGGPLWKQMSFRLSDERDPNLKGGGYLSIEDAQGSTTSTFLEKGFLDFLNKELLSYRYEEEDYEGLPFDFLGGYIGYIGYGLKVECSATSNRHKSPTPDACFFFADNFLVIDHHNDDVYIMSIQEGSTPVTPWLDETEQKLISLKASGTKKFKQRTSQNRAFSPCKGGFVAEKSKEQYIADIERCMKYIRDGESYELCLTTQIRKVIGEIDCLGLYLKLREKNPAPYAAWLNFSTENLCICSSSPERFLRLDKNGVLEAKPIKGTIARGTTMEEDEQLKLKLQHSEKDQSENLMIVDLLRNDLGRVCEPGSVHVPCLMDVESYATVHTMVSTIRGKKRSNISPIECVRAAFPGGSMTGAPKLRSMELLDSIESCSRGIYSGCIGFFSYNQTFDLNIVIRTVVTHDGEASIGAGGAIIALSNPKNEYEEMVLKTSAPAKAVMEFY